MSQQIEVDESAQLLGVESDAINILSPDLAYRRLAMVNVVYVGAAGANADDWVLVDAGLMGTASAIIHAAEDRFGDHSRPSAIILTHGHFDHVGALSALAEQWD